MTRGSSEVMNIASRCVEIFHIAQSHHARPNPSEPASVCTLVCRSTVLGHNADRALSGVRRCGRNRPVRRHGKKGTGQDPAMLRPTAPTLPANASVRPGRAPQRNARTSKVQDPPFAPNVGSNSPGSRYFNSNGLRPKFIGVTSPASLGGHSLDIPNGHPGTMAIWLRA